MYTPSEIYNVRFVLQVQLSDAEFKALWCRFKAAAVGQPAQAQAVVLAELADLLPDGVAVLAAESRST